MVRASMNILTFHARNVICTLPGYGQTERTNCNSLLASPSRLWARQAQTKWKPTSGAVVEFPMRPQIAQVDFLWMPSCSTQFALRYQIMDMVHWLDPHPANPLPGRWLHPSHGPDPPGEIPCLRTSERRSGGRGGCKPHVRRGKEIAGGVPEIHENGEHCDLQVIPVWWIIEFPRVGRILSDFRDRLTVTGRSGSAIQTRIFRANSHRSRWSARWQPLPTSCAWWSLSSDSRGPRFRHRASAPLPVHSSAIG